MAMFKPSQSHSGGITVKPYIAQELQFLTGEKKTKPILRLNCHSKNAKSVVSTLNTESHLQI